jgi:hypothetical protein
MFRYESFIQVQDKSLIAVGSIVEVGVVFPEHDPENCISVEAWLVGTEKGRVHHILKHHKISSIRAGAQIYVRGCRGAAEGYRLALSMRQWHLGRHQSG